MIWWSALIVVWECYLSIHHCFDVCLNCTESWGLAMLCFCTYFRSHGSWLWENFLMWFCTCWECEEQPPVMPLSLHHMLLVLLPLSSLLHVWAQFLFLICWWFTICMVCMLWEDSKENVLLCLIFCEYSHYWLSSYNFCCIIHLEFIWAIQFVLAFTHS